MQTKDNNKYIKGELATLLVHESLVRDHGITAAFILAHMYFLICKHGSHATTTKSISIRTGISRATIRKHLQRLIEDNKLCMVQGKYKPVYHIGINADGRAIRAYGELLSKGRKSATSGKLISIELRKIGKAAGKRAGQQRFIAYVKAYCIDKFASKLVRADEQYGYIKVGSINRFAKVFGVTRQTMSKILKQLSRDIVTVKFLGETIIDFKNTLATAIKQKHKRLAKAYVT